MARKRECDVEFLILSQPLQGKDSGYHGLLFWHSPLPYVELLFGLKPS